MSESAAAFRMVNRALAELRSGLPVRIKAADAQDSLHVWAVETTPLADLPAEVGLVLSAPRALALNLLSSCTLPAVRIDGASATQWQALTDPLATVISDRESLSLSPQAEDSAAAAAILLCKQVGLLPIAAVTATATPAAFIEVEGGAIHAHARQAAQQLRETARATVPLAAAEQVEVVGFRPEDGGVEHLALIVGKPDFTHPVLVRLHSECFTGDLLGSLRCDCGEQLQQAVAIMAEQGGGVVLYLAQEGRGIGLMNKLRAYNLQDSGLDTLDANLQLGFEDDERIYDPAARILTLLGVRTIRLMTNNPLKVAALQQQGITISERVPHTVSANGHNSRYLRTKSQRFGHLF